MRVDELIFSQREFLKELHALCKKWNVEISGCGCCGSPNIYFSDGTNFEDLYVDKNGLEVKTPKGKAYIDKEYHDIHIKYEYVDIDGDGCYMCYRVTASCPKCGKSKTVTLRDKREAERFALEGLEEMPCK